MVVVVVGYAIKGGVVRGQEEKEEGREGSKARGGKGGGVEVGKEHLR